MLISDLLDMDQLSLDIEKGYVNMRTHPENPDLHILNYADKCQYEPYWTPVTRKTRGLIFNSETNEIVARPFEKFFNYGQEAGVELDLDAEIFGAFDKMDGSLGVGYWDGTKYAIATRGSFESEQAIHATEWLHHPDNSQTLELVKAEIEEGLTPLFEIIYPENRIVVDYGSEDKLEYLGSSSMITEKVCFFPNLELSIGAPKTLRDVLSLPDRQNAEGLVVWLDSSTAVKIKQQDYVELHRIVSNLSQKEIWRQLSAGTVHTFIEALPDEFYKWADDTANALRKDYEAIEQQAINAFNELNKQNLDTRKDQAIWVTSNVQPDLKALIFLLLDNRPLDASIWKKLEPVGANPMKIIVE